MEPQPPASQTHVDVLGGPMPPVSVRWAKKLGIAHIITGCLMVLLGIFVPSLELDWEIFFGFAIFSGFWISWIILVHDRVT